MYLFMHVYFVKNDSIFIKLTSENGILAVSRPTIHTQKIPLKNASILYVKLPKLFSVSDGSPRCSLKAPGRT